MPCLGAPLESLRHAPSPESITEATVTRRSTDSRDGQATCRPADSHPAYQNVAHEPGHLPRRAPTMMGTVKLDDVNR
jgi:hypothetical protein